MSIPSPVQLALPFEGKVCTGCHQWVPLTGYAKYSRVSSGLQARCKTCRKKQWHEYHARMQPEITRRRREWVARNPDRVRAWYLRYKGKDVERFLRKAYEWKDRNREQIRAAGRAYWKQNPDKAVLARARRRAHIRGNGGTISRGEWSALKALYNYTCLCCKRQEPEIKLSLDHIIPISHGGPNTIENAQPLCMRCNRLKGIKHIDYRP